LDAGLGSDQSLMQGEKGGLKEKSKGRKRWSDGVCSGHGLKKTASVVRAPTRLKKEVICWQNRNTRLEKLLKGNRSGRLSKQGWVQGWRRENQMPQSLIGGTKKKKGGRGFQQAFFNLKRACKSWLMTGCGFGKKRGETHRPTRNKR